MLFESSRVKLRKMTTEDTDEMTTEQQNQTCNIESCIQKKHYLNYQVMLFCLLSKNLLPDQ